MSSRILTQFVCSSFYCSSVLSCTDSFLTHWILIYPTNLSKLNKFKKEAKKFKHQVAALKKKVVRFEEERKDDNEEPPEQDAGDQFGGQASKKARKA